MSASAPLRLRDATPADVPLVNRLVRSLAEYERLLHEAVATDDDFRRLLFGEPPRAWALIAEWEGEPVGFALWYYSVSTFLGRPSLYVEDVFVDPAHRNRGIGRLLFADLARRAVAEGCGRMEWSVLDWNAPSIAFYRSIGARPRQGWTLQRLSGEALQALAAKTGS
ncbi:MAG: GNAT family N-acetyltransferase [Acetobacteraceae bacterium]|nr:GNAT family N-acetyltransferase [Acetobacteraceae bacterium]